MIQIKRLSDAEIEEYAQKADKWSLIDPTGYNQLIQIELSLRILDKLNDKEERRLVLA